MLKRMRSCRKGGTCKCCTCTVHDFTYLDAIQIFTTGVGVGMFYYGVSEPLWHQSSHWFAEAGYRSQHEIDQMALVITIYHWGFHGYVSYLTVAIATALASYQFRLPLIFRSTFYVSKLLC